MSHLGKLKNYFKVNTKTPNKSVLTNMLGNVFQYFLTYVQKLIIRVYKIIDVLLLTTLKFVISSWS